MRFPLILILFLITSYAQAQNFFIVRASKDSLDGFMPFYDAHENEIKGMFSFDPNVDIKNHLLSYAFQVKNLGNTNADIYGATISIKKLNFDFVVPINDTFIKSGNYRLVFRLANQKGDSLLQENDFHFQTLRTPNDFYKSTNPGYVSLIKNKVSQSASNIDINKTFASSYDLARIKINIDASSAIADKAEQGALEGIIKNDNLEELQRFFYNFWYARNPQNPEAEWKVYADKLNYVADKYGYGVVKGYQTDKGRLYLRYGPPNREVRASSERGTRPYEVWFYNELDKHTNLNLLFVQMGSLANERILLHSSDPEFYFNPQWVSQLFTEPTEQYNTNSHRVYDFFKR